MAGDTQQTKFLISFKGEIDDVLKKQIKETLKKVASDFKDVEGKVTESSDKIKRSNKRLELSFTELAKRALIVIPTWQALRGAYSALFGTISQGADYILETEKAFNRARGVSMDLGADLDRVMTNVRKTAEVLSQETGKSVAELLNTYAELKTGGLDVETSQAGMQVAMEGSIALQEDQAKVSEFLYKLYNLQGKSIEGVTTPLEKMRLALAKVNSLDKDNAITLDQMIEGYDSLASTGANLGYSFDETIALLAVLNTLGIEGAKAGTLMSTSLANLTQKIPEVNQMLGQLSSSADTPFQSLMNLLNVLDRLGKEGKKDVLAKVFQELGGTKTTKPIRALSEGLGLLQNNMKTLGQEAEITFNGLKARFDYNIKSIPEQVKQFQNLRAQVGQGFLIGLTGGKDFEDSLSKINDLMQSLITVSNGAGIALRKVFESSILNDYLKALTNVHNRLKEVKRENEKDSSKFTIPNFLTSPPLLFSTISAGKLFNRWISSEGIKNRTLEKDINKIINPFTSRIDHQPQVITGTNKNYIAPVSYTGYEVDKRTAEQRAIDEGKAQLLSNAPKIKSYSLLPEESDKLKLLMQETKYNQMRLKGVSEVAIAEAKLNDLLTTRVDSYNKMLVASKSQLAPITASQVKSKLLKGDWEGIKQLFEGSVFTLDDMVEAQKLVNELSEQELRYQTEIVDKRARKRVELLANIELESKGIKYMQMEISGANSIQIAYAEMQDTIKAHVKAYNDKVKAGAKDLENLTEQEVLALALNGDWEKLIDKYQKAGLHEDNLLEVAKSVNAVYEQRLQLIKDTADELNSTVQSSLSDTLLNADPSKLQAIPDFFRKKITDSITGRIADVLTKQSGFGELFGEAITGIRYKSPVAQESYDALVAGGKKVGESIERALGKGVASSLPVDGQGNITNGIISNIFGNPTGYGANVSQGQSANKMSAIGGLVSSVLTGYSQYSSAKQGGASSGMAGASAGLTGIGSLLTMSGLGMIGAPMMIAGMLLPFFSKNKTKPTREVTEKVETQQVASKIDVSNRILTMMNRNLVGLRQQFTYIMPSSTYFSTATNLEDQFSINRRRGI